jgi:hypothetical protein
MIDLMFLFGSEVILVKIDGDSVLFGNTSYGARLSDISGLRISRDGVIREHPDLVDNPDWKEKAIIRFKEHIKKLDTEGAIADYIKNDLKKYGYTLKKIQINGRRPQFV